MRLRHAVSIWIVTILGVLAATAPQAEVRFNLRGYVPATCAIEKQTAYPDGAATLIDLQVSCNLNAFSISAPGASAIALRSHQVIGETTETPVIVRNRDSIEFAELRPGRREITLRVISPTGSIGLVLDTR